MMKRRRAYYSEKLTAEADLFCAIFAPHGMRSIIILFFPTVYEVKIHYNNRSLLDHNYMYISP